MKIFIDLKFRYKFFVSGEMRSVQGHKKLQLQFL